MNEEKKYLKLITILFRTMQNVEHVLKTDIQAYGLNSTEFGTLELLYHKGKQPIQAICDRLLMANSSLTYVVSQLEKKEFIKKVSNKKDKRMTLVELTTKGKNFFESIFPSHIMTVKNILGNLDENEIDPLMHMLKKIGYKAFEINGERK
ncbi:MAG: MarR family transcriptional regulator [Tenericutes bacterium]|nr:MarR family transcriptional regulator [Mycoplasmatota bacterium]